MDMYELLDLGLDFAGETRTEAGRRIGFSRQLTSLKLKSDSLDINEMFDMLDACGIDVILKSKETGKKLQRYSGGSELKSLEINASKFVKVAELCGVEIEMYDRNTKQKVRRLGGVGRRIYAMVRGELFDTSKALALSNDFFADGVHKYSPQPEKSRELFKLRDGRYLFAVYSEGELDRLKAASPREAKEFIEKNGTDLYHGRTEEEVELGK